MAVVEYSDSDDSDAAATPSTPPLKKRKVDVGQAKQLPPLPDTFLDLYSSSVRPSTQDDPLLHGGRKRVTSHVEGNWPTHVFLEWNPAPEEHRMLASYVVREAGEHGQSSSSDQRVHSLLTNELGVPLPLHVSLSRPLVLKTEQKETFLKQIRYALSTSHVRTVTAQLSTVRWHPNEDKSRWFLVVQLRKLQGDELGKLLKACNTVASAFDQPLLYPSNSTSRDSPQDVADSGQFHISIAWSLTPPRLSAAEITGDDATPKSDVGSSSITEHSNPFNVTFAEVKVRIGQEVEVVPLLGQRTNKKMFSA
ncbi:hypothetical protein LTR62_007732 [Meristemomyces frigidus]|uniref:U6 snRNA phosphodiesterase n=1 Tax=Meristemomyces frigidus TaxID=1508187 RepID=A0AAN7TBF2_9PEZI|nr:hypothetical protein LTR62_007732 [Meristemomyces frigidus]